MKTIQPSMMERVYAAMADNPASTTQELNAICQLGNIRVAKMVAELVAEGRAVAMGKRPCKITRRWMTYWRTMA